MKYNRLLMNYEFYHILSQCLFTLLCLEIEDNVHYS